MVDGARAPIPITEERRRAIGLVRSGRVERRGVLRTFGRGFGFHRGCNRRGGIARRRGSESVGDQQRDGVRVGILELFVARED